MASARSASLSSSLLRVLGVVSRHVVLKALRAAATARSTSFSVASLTEVMTSSVEGLMTSNFFLSTPSTHSLLMNLCARRWSAQNSQGQSGSAQHLQAGGLCVLASNWRGELDGESHDVASVCLDWGSKLCANKSKTMEARREGIGWNGMNPRAVAEEEGASSLYKPGKELPTRLAEGRWAASR